MAQSDASIDEKFFFDQIWNSFTKERNIYESKEVSSSWNDGANAWGDYLWDAEILQIPHRQKQTVEKM